MRRGTRVAAFALSVLLSASCGKTLPPRAPEPPQPAPARPIPVVQDSRADLLWDTYGVPHIFAKDAVASSHAFGWAQMRAHGDLLLRLYGQARGRGAEYWGESFASADEWTLTNDIPERAAAWLEQQRPLELSIIQSFVNGINGYAAAHPDSVSAEFRQVLPINPVDVLAHSQRVINYTFIASRQGIMGAERAWESAGSNGWTVAPRRSASGNTMMLANPHLPWGDLFTWFEAQISTPEGDTYGAALVGSPTLAIAFNDSLGWTHTVNTMDGADLYQLTLRGNGYMYDGVERAFDTSVKTMKVRQPDGTLATRTFTVKRSVHGPVIGESNGRALALRVTGTDAPHIVQQYWEMSTSKNLDDFEHALSRQQAPFFTVMYADAIGNIMHVFNGRIPARNSGDSRLWEGIVRGDSSSNLWNTIVPYDQLPRVINPPTGWLQNANDPPWTTTVPLAIDETRFPAWLSTPPSMSFRAIRSARMLYEDPSITFDEMIAYKHSTRSEEADHILEDVIHAGRASGSNAARAAADVLAAWDRMTDADSRGAVLFEEFARAFNARRAAGLPAFDAEWTKRAPLATPDGIADPVATVRMLEAAADRVRARYGSLEVSWGETHRLMRDGVDLPANGGPSALGIFRSVAFDSIAPTRSVASSGDSYVAVIEFSKPLRARTLLTYGNWSKAGSPHRTDQLALFSRKELRTVWRTRSVIEQHLELKESF